MRVMIRNELCFLGVRFKDRLRLEIHRKKTSEGRFVVERLIFN